MKYDKYQLESDKKLLVFEFTSVGPKGRIKKIVQYSETNLKDYFNLGFGDKDEKNGEINDLVITNNGDTTILYRSCVLPRHLILSSSISD